MADNDEFLVNEELGAGEVQSSSGDQPERTPSRVAVHDRAPLSFEDFASRRVRNVSLNPVQPFLVLLPRLGETSALEQVKDSLESRAKQLQASSQRGQREHTAEESMLSQVLQWLQVADHSRK